MKNFGAFVFLEYLKTSKLKILQVISNQIRCNSSFHVLSFFNRSARKLEMVRTTIL